MGAKTYVNDKYQLSDAFKNDTKEIFNAEADSINVSNPDAAAKKINDWV